MGQQTSTTSSTASSVYPSRRKPEVLTSAQARAQEAAEEAHQLNSESEILTLVQERDQEAAEEAHQLNSESGILALVQERDQEAAEEAHELNTDSQSEILTSVQARTQDAAERGPIHQGTTESEILTSVQARTQDAAERGPGTTEPEILVLAEEAMKDGLIQHNVIYQLKSLHPQVPNSMKYRYLLACFNTALKECKAGNDCIPKKFQKYHLQPPTNTFCDVEEEVVLSFDQLPDLVEFLVAHAYKWREMGIALRFKPQHLDTIQACPLLIQNSPKSYLTRLLEDWLSKHALPPTISNLKRALNSQTVGLGYLASNLMERIACKHLIQVTPSYSIVKISASDAGIDFTRNTIASIKLAEGQSTILEVQVETSQQYYTPEYEWLRNGIAINDGSHYSGTTSPILFIKTDIFMDGFEFTCSVQIQPECYVLTPSIKLNVVCILDKHKNSLVSRYLAQPEVPEDTWPPSGNVKFINLALIRQEVINYGSAYARLTVRGDIDDVLQSKQMLEYKDLYKSLSSSRQLLVIEGRPGSGKTTFVHKMVRDWATTSEGGIRLMLLVSLRVLNTMNRPELSDILKLFKGLKVDDKLIEEREGEGVCFIFDGLDEFAPPEGEHSIVFMIINKAYLYKSTVVVASRPAAVAQLRHKANRVVEVVGFLKEQILEYFSCYPFSRSTKSTELKAYLSLHPNILHMCYLPIHAAMIAFLFEVKGEVPKTETEIYNHFTRFTLMRNLTKNKAINVNAIDINKLTGEQKHCFDQICRLAFEKTVSSKQVLDQDEVSSYFQADTDVNNSLGLITIDRTAGLYGFKEIYTFLHLTFQEYLAAYHISTLSDEEQMRLIQDHGHENHMLVVWKFYCGLIKINPYEKKFKTVLQKTESNVLYRIQCAYETQQRIACAQVLKSIDYHIQLADKYLSTPDFTAIGYVTNTAILPTKLSLTNCDIDNEGVDAILSEMEDKARDSLDSLDVEVKQFDALNSECIIKLLSNLRSLKHIFIKAEARTNFQNNPTAVSVDNQFTNVDTLSLINMPWLLHSDMHLVNITALNLQGSINGLHMIEILVEILNSENLKTLNLCNNYITKNGAKLLARALQSCKSLEKFYVSTVYTHQQEVCSTDILAGLEKCTNLQFLDISLNGEDICNPAVKWESWKKLKELRVAVLYSRYGESALALAGKFQYLSELEMFSLKYSIDNPGSATSLMSNLQFCSNLQILDLSDNLIGPAEIKVIATGLEKFSNMKELHLNNNSLGNEGIENLSSYLRYCRGLEKLSLSHNNISSEGFKVLAANLHRCPQLRHLNLKENFIVREEAVHTIEFSLEFWEDLILSL